MTQEDITLSVAGVTTDSAAAFLPVNSVIESVIAFVVTTIAGGGVTKFSVGDATTAQRFIADHATLTANAKKVGLRHLEPTVVDASDTWDPGSLADGVGETSAAITATGAVLGDYVLVSAPYDLQGITCNGYVSAANEVKIRLQNETTGVIDLASGTWKIRVIRSSHDGPDQVAAAAARITCDATPTAGVVRLTVFYRQYVAEV